MIRLPPLHSHSGASSKEGDREKREEEGGRRGLRLLLGKNDAAAVLGACRQTGGGGEEEGRGGSFAQSAVSDVGFTVSNPFGDVLRFSSVLNTLD